MTGLGGTVASAARLGAAPSSVALSPKEGDTHGAGDLQRQKWEKRLRVTRQIGRCFTLGMNCRG